MAPCSVAARFESRVGQSFFHCLRCNNEPTRRDLTSSYLYSLAIPSSLVIMVIIEGKEDDDWKEMRKSS
jgi:hypothetical protein